MKSNYKIFTAVFLSAIMTAAAPLTVCGAEVFSAGESFSDGTGSIPAILTDMVLPGGEIGTEYQVQLEADTDVNWSLEEGSELPAGFTLSSGGVISGMPQEEGSFSFTVQADNGIGVSSQELSLYVAQREQEPVIKQYELTSGTALIDLGIHAEGEQSRKRLFLYNAGTDSLHLSDFPQSRYFDFSYAPIFDTNTDEEMQPGSCAAVDIDDKKNLPAGNYEETVTFETKEGASCKVTLKVIVGASSEKDYELSIETGTEEEFTESDFYDPEFRVEKYVVVRNSGKKETRIRIDTSGLKNFEVDDQMAKWTEDYEEQDSKKLLKPGETLYFYILPKQEYGIYDETFAFLADDGSRYPLHVTMNREKNPTEKKQLEITEKSAGGFPTMQWGYKTLPEAKTYILKNVTDTDMKLSFNRSKECSVLLSGNAYLAPGESTELRLWPKLGLSVGKYSFQVTVTAKTVAGEHLTTQNLYNSFIVGDRTYQGLADAVAPVTGITNGAEKTADALHLPKSLEVYGAEVNGEKTTFSASVKWDVENCAYDPKSKAAQSFLVNGSLELNEDENNEGLDTAVQIMVQVDAYQTLNRPVIDTRWTRVITNYAMLYLRDLSNEADGYQFVTAKSQKDLKKGNYTAQTKITNSELNQYPELKYIPEGTHSLYCRAYKENSSHVMEYGEWSDGVPVTVKAKTPDAPVVQKVQVKKNDVRIVLNSKGEEPDGYDVVAARSKNGKEPSDYIKVKSGYSGSSKELILRGVPAGTWYIGVHAYKYLNGSNTKVLSKWAEVRKVTVKTSLVTGKPAVKSAKVSRQGTKRNVTVTFTAPKSCDGTDWVLAKKVSKSDDGSYTGVSSYAYTKKNQTKTTVVFKSVKPGVYYLAGRAYVKGYAKSYTKWSKIKKIVVK